MRWLTNATIASTAKWGRARPVVRKTNRQSSTFRARPLDRVTPRIKADPEASGSCGAGFRGLPRDHQRPFSLGGSFQSRSYTGKFDKYQGLFAKRDGFDVARECGRWCGHQGTTEGISPVRRRTHLLQPDSSRSRTPISPSRPRWVQATDRNLQGMTPPPGSWASATLSVPGLRCAMVITTRASRSTAAIDLVQSAGSGGGSTAPDGRRDFWTGQRQRINIACPPAFRIGWGK